MLSVKHLTDNELFDCLFCSVIAKAPALWIKRVTAELIKRGVLVVSVEKQEVHSA